MWATWASEVHSHNYASLADYEVVAVAELREETDKRVAERCSCFCIFMGSDIAFLAVLSGL